MPRALFAYADESVRVSADPPLYMLAATVIPEGTDLTPLESMLPRGAKKLHWRDLGTRAQRQSLTKVAELGSRSTIVVASPIDPKKQERARRKDLEVLLPILEAEGVTKLVMESRFPAADVKDAAHFRAMLKRGTVSTLELEFADPSREHRLWIPDQILGAYAEAAIGSSSSKAWRTEWELIKGSVTTVQVSL